MEFVDIIVRCHQVYGYLPILKVEEKEVHRGEFQKTPEAAFEKAKKVAQEQTLCLKL